MKIKDCFILRDMGEFSIVVAKSEAIKDFNCMITLNASGVMLWKLLEKGADKEQLLNAMTSEYNVEKELASEHIGEFLEKLEKAGILQ